MLLLASETAGVFTTCTEERWRRVVEVAGEASLEMAWSADEDRG